MTAPPSNPPSAIDASCRLPLFGLFGGAAVCLALASGFGLIASLSFHKASLFADCAMLSYGRAYPAWSHLLVYGFCVPAGLGAGLWLLARLGRVEVAKPWLIAFGAKLWNLGVLVGLIGILAGDASGFEWFEMPRYAVIILLAAFLIITLCAFITHYGRSRRHEEADSPSGTEARFVTSEPTLYPSQWFVVAALFWFPWIFTTAGWLLHYFQVRGVVQVAVGWWYAGNLLNVWLPLTGLAATFYLLPKITGRPLQSQYLALFAFLTLVVFGTWTGMPAHAPLPAWMPTLSGGASLLALVPALAVVASAILTCRGSNVACLGGPLCYAKFGVVSFAVSSLLIALTACPLISRVTDFTWFNHGHATLRLYGFFVMTMTGAAYYILPRVSGIEICANRVRANFWLFVIGTLLFTLPLVAGGVTQGAKLLDPSILFLDTAKPAMMAFRMSTLGEVLIAAGSGLFLFNVLAVMAAWYRSVCRQAFANATARLETAEAQS